MLVSYSQNLGYFCIRRHWFNYSGLGLRVFVAINVSDIDFVFWPLYIGRLWEAKFKSRCSR
jgi:hypothetical protein